MGLPKAQLSRLYKHLADTWPKGCPFCQSKKRTIYSYVDVGIRPKPSHAPHTHLPCAAVRCEGCGDVRLVSLATAGVLDGPEAVAAAAEDEAPPTGEETAKDEAPPAGEKPAK